MELSYKIEEARESKELFMRELVTKIDIVIAKVKAIKADILALEKIINLEWQ